MFVKDGSWKQQIYLFPKNDHYAEYIFHMVVFFFRIIRCTVCTSDIFSGFGFLVSKQKKSENRKKVYRKKVCCAASFRCFFKNNGKWVHRCWLFYSLVWCIGGNFGTIKIENNYLEAASSRAGTPAELKHIIKRRKRKQQWLP